MSVCFNLILSRPKYIYLYQLSELHIFKRLLSCLLLKTIVRKCQINILVIKNFFNSSSNFRTAYCFCSIFFSLFILGNAFLVVHRELRISCNPNTQICVSSFLVIRNQATDCSGTPFKANTFINLERLTESNAFFR